MSEATTRDHQRGYDKAEAANRTALATHLRIMLSNGELSAFQARDIFTGTFGLLAAVDEFGPDPTMDGTRARR